MTMDKEGNQIIKQGLKEDIAREKERLRKEIEEEYQPKFNAIIGKGTMRERAETTTRIELEREFDRRLKEASAFLEKQAFGELGEDHANLMAEKEERIQGAKDRWREQEQNNETKRSAWSNSPYSRSNQFNKEASKEERLEDIKERWREHDKAKEQQKGHDRDMGGRDI